MCADLLPPPTFELLRREELKPFKVKYAGDGGVNNNMLKSYYESDKNKKAEEEILKFMDALATTDKEENNMEKMIGAFKKIVDDWEKEQNLYAGDIYEEAERNILNKDPVFDYLRNQKKIFVEEAYRYIAENCAEEDKEDIKKAYYTQFKRIYDGYVELLSSRTHKSHAELDGRYKKVLIKIRTHAKNVRMLLDTITTHEQGMDILHANHITDRKEFVSEICRYVWTKEEILPKE